MEKTVIETTSNPSVLWWVIGALWGVLLLLVGWLRYDDKKEKESLWKRADRHGHKIECAEEKCKPKTSGVIVHED